MARLARRDLAAEVAKHFHGTPTSRLREARRLGRKALAFYRAGLEEKVTRAEAHRQLERAKNQGRRHSGAIEALRG